MGLLDIPFLQQIERINKGDPSFVFCCKPGNILGLMP